MNARASIDRSIRRFVTLYLLGFVLFFVVPLAAFVLGVLDDGDPRIFLFMLPGVVILFGSFCHAMFFGIRCPSCKGNLAPLALW